MPPLLLLFPHIFGKFQFEYWKKGWWFCNITFLQYFNIGYIIEIHASKMNYLNYNLIKQRITARKSHWDIHKFLSVNEPILNPFIAVYICIYNTEYFITYSYIWLAFSLEWWTSISGVKKALNFLNINFEERWPDIQ